MKRLAPHRKKILYLAAGAWNTAFGYGAFAGLYLLGRRFGWHYLAALAISNVLAILNAYLSYKLLVFRTRGRWLGELARFSMVYWVVFAANAAALPALVRGLGLNPLAAQAVFTAVTVAAGYLAHDRFSFAAPPPQAASRPPLVL